MTTVRLEKIAKAFGKFVALHPLDLTINAGELFFLLGPSGCGKSTLLRLIAGLHEPTGGRMFFNDRDVTDLATDKRNTAMCFQSYALWPHMSVRDNIRFGLDIRKTPDAEARQRVDDAISLVQLEKHADKKPNELSGGQQQRVALARALVVRPDCLLLDEPLSNLDAKLRLEMRGEIRRICRASNLTAIYVTHDQKEALSIADRMAVLNAGKIEQIGKPQELYLRPHNKFVANFMGETNFIEGTVSRADASHAYITTPMGELWSTVKRGPDGKDFAPGAKVLVSIRPETVQLGTLAPNAGNVFEATITDTVYLGEVAQHVVHIAKNGTPTAASIRAFELNPRFVARDGAVERAKVWFDPADVMVLPG
jgi:iron(III) transport system ATP-binding protein